MLLNPSDERLWAKSPGTLVGPKLWGASSLARLALADVLASYHRRASLLRQSKNTVVGEALPHCHWGTKRSELSYEL